MRIPVCVARLFAVLAMLVVPSLAVAQDVYCPTCPEVGEVEQCYGPGLYWTGHCSNWRRPCTPKMHYLPGYKPVYAGYNATWYASGEYLALFRDQDGRVNFASDGADPTAIVLSTGDFKNEFQSGARITVGKRFAPDYRLEGTYFGSYSWGDQVTLNDPTGNLFSPFTDFGNPAVVGLDNNTRVTANFGSSLNNAEINLRHRMTLPSQPVEASFLIGGRYIHIDEHLTYFSVDVPGNQTLLDIDANDRMLGLQIGIQSQFLFTQKIWVDWDIKGGIFGNAAQQTTVFTQTPAGGGAAAVTGSRDENVTSFLGETQVSANYQFLPNWTFRAGYNAMWLTGVALADANFETNVATLTNGPAGLQHASQVVYHGLNVGVVWTR